MDERDGREEECWEGSEDWYLFGQQGDEVPLKLRLDHLHHVLDLCGLAAVNQLIQCQQLLWATPALKHTCRRAKGEKRRAHSCVCVCARD